MGANYSADAIGNVALGAASLLVPDFRVWHLKNTDTGETIDGQFEAQELTKNVSASFSRETALGRQHPITMFLSGQSDRISFRARYFRRDTLASVKEKIDLLTWWAKINPVTRKPPVCLFWVGDGSIYMLSTIDSISNIVYDPPTFGGGVRGASLVVNLVQYTPFAFKAAPAPETRYARTEQGAYQELLAAIEYGNPMLGVLLRQRAPSQRLVQPGTVVKLPSLEAIQRAKIEPKSIAFRTLRSTAPSPQKAARQNVLDRLSRSVVSHIIPRGF